MTVVPPEPRTRFVPVRVTKVPAGPDLGLKSAMEGAPKLTVIVCVELFPATSVATTVIVFDPFVSVAVQLNVPLWTVVDAPLHVTAATPERLSDTVPETTKLAFVTVELFAGEVIARAGAVLSILSVTDAVALSPIASVAVALMTWFAPSVVTVCELGHCTGATPPVHW